VDITFYYYKMLMQVSPRYLLLAEAFSLLITMGRHSWVVGVMTVLPSGA
jgi:hypothetical protein